MKRDAVITAVLLCVMGLVAADCGKDVMGPASRTGEGRLLLVQCVDCYDYPKVEKECPPQVICDKHYRFAIPGCPGAPPAVRGIVDQKTVILPPSGPDSKDGNGKNGKKPEPAKNGKKADDAKNGGNGGGDEKKEEAVPSLDRTWDVVQQG